MLAGKWIIFHFLSTLRMFSSLVMTGKTLSLGCWNHLQTIFQLKVAKQKHFQLKKCSGRFNSGVHMAALYTEINF